MSERKETRDHVPDSTSGMSDVSPMIGVRPQEGSRIFSDDVHVVGGVVDGRRSIQGTGRPLLRDAVAHSQRSDSAGIRSGYTAR